MSIYTVFQIAMVVFIISNVSFLWLRHKYRTKYMLLKLSKIDTQSEG